MIIKFIKKKFDLIKICAVFTTVCFVVSTLGANLYAIPLAENANKKYEDVFNKVSSISAEYGKITSSKDAQSDITIINIQDLHCHPQTQRNISKIITQIADKYNLKKIYVEGGYGDIDTSWLNTIKDEKIKRQIIEGLLEEGILTGSEYYKLTNNNEVELKGIDEEQIHKDNVRRLSWIIANQDKYKDVIKKVENEINILEKMYVNSRNERFNRDIEKYLTNEIDSRRFYRQLAKYVKDINENPDKYNNITAIRLEDYPNITKFIALRKTAKDIDVKEVTQQLQMVINELKNRLPYNVYTRLLSETENLSDSQKVVELITMLCNKEGINLENKYKSLHTFLESNGINRELNTVELVQEERQLLSEIRKALSYNNEEYEITFISDFSKYFKDYLEYKLTDADWKYFEKEFDQFITLYSKYATVNRIQEIYGDFEEINKYYKINDQRNNIFVANLLKGEEISVSETDRVRQEEEILKNSKEVIIAVTGGFHSTELEEILAKKEVNTIVITPSIFEGIEKATKQYKGIIKEQSRYFQHQALAYTLASCTTDEYKKNLLYSMAKDLLGGNVERLREALGQDVDLTVFDNLQPLTEQEQEQISEQKNIIVSAASDIAADVLPKEGGKAIFVPNVSEIILKVSRSLVDAGIFLNNGPVFAAEELGLPNLDDISPEEYSRMPDSIQEALVAKEYGTEAESDERANEEENFAEESIDETEDVETLVEEETVDSSYLSEERKSELLKRLNNDKEALDLLIDICCRKSVNFDLSKDSALLEMFIRKLNLGEDYLDFDYMYDIVKRSIHVANTFPIDTDLKFACFEKFIDFFNSEDKNKNGEVYYITLFRRLFSLNKKSLQFFYETLDGLSANDLVFYYDASKINKNLKFLLENFDKGIYEITDYSRLVNLFDNIDKLSFLSEGEFSYLISLPNKIFVSVLYSSTDSFQLKTKLTVGKKYYYKGCDEDVARAIFDKAEKLQGLNVVFYPAFSRLNKEAILFILDSVNNSSEIEKILSLYRGMGLSPEFENSTRLKDFKDPRFKALVQYISSIQDRDFYDKLFFGIYDRENLRNIVNSIDDANFVKDYLLNPDYQKIYKNLFKKLADLNIKNVAAENNHLALKLILNKEFNQILTESGIDNISDEDNIIARYYSAIAVSRMIFDGVGGEKIYYDFNDEAGMELIKEVTDTYLEIMKEMLNVVLLDSDTKIYALCNSERVYGRDRFNIDTLQEIIEYMGIQLEIPGENVYRRVGNNKNASKGWLNAIETFVMDSIRTKGYFMFRGHGNENMLWVYDPKENDNGLATGDMLEVITPRELAESLFKLATRDQDPVDLRNITIDLSSCYSYYFARSVYNILEQKFKAENKTESYPTIITAAGLETEFGITDFRGMEGNLHKGINKLLRNFQRGSVSALTLGMVGVSEYMFSDSNITMFSSFFDENMLERIAKTRESIAKFNISRHRTVETEPDILDNIEQTATRVNIRNAKKIAIRILPKFVTESSVFRKDKTAPLWEELVYRAIPTLALTALLIASTMFLPAVPVVAVIAKLTCIGIFSLVQVRFIKAHIVTDWLKAMDAGGPVNLKDVFEDKSLTGREKINKTIEIIKKRILVIFPNSKEERSFYRFYTRNKQAISHREGLIIPTIVFSLPYLAAIIFFNSMPVVAIATVISMALHFVNNEVARTLEEKEKLKEKQSSVKFLDIQKRLSHVELLIDNPQMKMDLPEIRVGRLALMFGLETINERRAKNLSDYEKVRDSFINRLDPEILQKEKESIEKELSRIEGKKRKTKKDKEKIAELKEKLEIIEKEYPEIRAELLSADTKKVEKIIDSINSLLPIFEEIEGILEEIEFFREVNGDTEETRELEREFLDFTEQTLMRELMSLYDANVTGLHVRRVVAFSKLIGSNMPFGNNVRMMYNLMLSSILHDIGKNLVPGTILNKQGSFDDLERDIMDFHVVFGGFILRSSILKNLSYTAENHHYTTKNSPRSYSFDSKMGYEHEAADYEEAQIAKIVTLTDVYEAVSPKLSFSTERTYQFPKKIRDISDMLENISAEVDLTESQKKEVIVLLAEIAQIDSEEDVIKKQEMEQAFIKKVLYDRSRNFVINYIREKNYDFVRANAFKVIFTKSPQDLFKELGKTEEEFMYDYEIDPEGTIDKCMSLVSEFEFDTAVVRAFLEFYFSSEDININDEIIESLNKEKESDFIVYMKKLSYSFYKMFRRARFMMVRFAPVIASVFRGLSEQEEGVSIKEKFNIDTVVNYTVVIKRRNGDTHFLYFDERDFQEMGRKNSGVKKGLDSYGIQEIKYDEDGKIVDIILEPGATIDTDASGGEILVGSEAENLSFEDIEEQIKENYERKHHQKLEQEGFLLKPIMEDTGTTEKVDVYLDDDVKTILATIEDAINNNKLMVIHVFKEGFKTQNLSLWQRYQKYKVVYGLLDSRSKFESTFSKTSEIEEQFLKQIEDGLSEEERDMEWIKRNAAKTFFALREVLKNNFDHGNLGLFEYPIALHISKDNNGRVTEFSTYNLSTKPITLDRAEEKSLSDLMYEAYISGSHKGAEYMTDSFFTNLEYGDDIKISVGEEVYRIYRTKVTLKTEQEQEQALEKYNQYRQQKAEERRRYEQASEAEKKEIEEQEKKRNLAAFWDDFISILKPFGVKLGNYAHVWEEVVFRYLPTAFILLGYMNPLVGLGIQIVFILAHPLAKWMAARMNWEKAKKEGKQVGEKAGIGDLFKQIGKDFSLLTPTLVMMLPYVGALLSLAINPALSLIITPAIFTFTDVIVKWLTKKDSGGEVISIDKNLVIFITIVSLGSYIFLPLIPVIHPIVNALINPIVITNAINAGYLHYEYNKRQQDRSKSLSIFSSSLSEARKAELLAKLDNNEEALNSLIKICREESINFDLSKDTPLTDLKIACFKKYSSFLTDEFDGKNPELKRINFFRRLFSLSEDNLEFLYNEIDNVGVELLLLDTDDADYEADDIDANLTTLLSVHKEELLKLAKTDYETFPDTLYNFLRPSNIKKVTSLSKEDFAYLISPSMVKHYNTILLLSKDSSQLKIKLAANKAFGFTMRDIKQEILRKILTIFDNVKDLSDIEKILQLCEENKISSDFDSSKGVEDFKDMRFKAFVRYVSSTDDKSFYNDLFKFYGKKNVFNWKGEDSYDKKDQRILKIIVDSIDDISFIKEYLLNSDRNKIYKTLFAGLADLDIKKVAVENDHLALKLLIDENFNKILNDSRIHDNVPQEKILVARYHAAIAVSRFIYDSVENEVAGYDLSNDEIKEQIGKITELYIEAVRQAGKIVIMDSQTKIYGLFNDEIMEGTERFNEEAILKMLGIIQKANPNQKLPAPTFYKRNDRDHGPEAAKSWLDAMEDLILESTQKKQEKAYFVFRGHGEHKDNEDPDKSDYLKVNGSEKIYAKELAERLFNLAKRTENPVDLRRVTIDLSCCDSYFFARSVHKYLEQMYEEYAKTNKGFKETFPIIISAGGLEERSGITIDIRKISDSRKKLGNTKWIGNLHEGILQILDGKSELTLGMLALSEYKFLFSNITIFASFDDEMTKEIEKVRKNTLDVFGKYSIGPQIETNEQQPVQEEQETAETKRNVGGEMTVPTLHAGRMEMSILKPLNLKIDDLPYIWEEGLFRYLPTAIIVSKFLISLTTPFTGIYVAAAFIAIQLLFISAHSVVKWKVEKSTNENLGVGGLFKQIGHDIKNLIIPTLTLMLPYAGSLITLAINPALSILLTPALLTFADVIVKWLTRKDSGGEVSINKNLIIVSLIASLVSYTLLPAIPVINPLVNALINPVLAVNTAGAGYLHYQYNEAQRIEVERSKISDLIRDNAGNVDFVRVRTIFPKRTVTEIENIYRAVKNGTAKSSDYSEKTDKEIYFLFVFSEKTASFYNQDNFPGGLIHAAYSSIIEQNGDADASTWNTCFRYMKKMKNISKDEDADAILKMFSALYAYNTWKKLKEDGVYTMRGKNETEEFEFSQGNMISFEKWVHVCDGHSIFTNGIELDSWGRYYGNIGTDEGKYKSNAINGILTLGLLLNTEIMERILTDPDIVVTFDDSDKSRKYIKRIGDKVYIYIVRTNNFANNEKNLLTFYVKSYQNAAIEMDAVLRKDLRNRVNNATYKIIAKINSGDIISGSDANIDGHDSDYYFLEENAGVFVRGAGAVDGKMDSKIELINKLNQFFGRASNYYGEINIVKDGTAYRNLYVLLMNIVNNPNISDEDIENNEVWDLFGESNAQRAQKGRLKNGFVKNFVQICREQYDFFGENGYRSNILPIMEDFVDKLERGNPAEKNTTGKSEISLIVASLLPLIDSSYDDLNTLYFIKEISGGEEMSAILPENMGLVNRIMQSKFGNAFVAATVIAFKEFKASMKPSFVDMHQSESGRKGAQQLRDFITRFDVVETDGLAARIIKTILGTIVKGASIVKHIAIDYRYIKSSGIQEAISMFGNNTYMDEYGQIHIPPVLIVNDLKGLKNLNNTGIKVNGRYIYQVGQKGMLIYGAEGVNSEDISMAVNESQMIKDAIEQMIREKGYEGVSVEVNGVIQGEGEGVRFENGITIIGTDELQNKSADYIDGYVSSSIELKRSMGVMYSQKALISLESIDDTEKLRQALKQGRARKIISKAQYDQLQMPYEELMTMREAGIEIYVDSNEIDENLKKAGITGQIIRKDNQIFIHDYYTQEDVEVEEVGENNSLTDIENMLVNSQKLILIDIKVLADKFQKENILGAYKGLNNLIGNMKLKTGIGQLTETDIKSLGYNLDYNKLPQLTLSKPLQEYTKVEIEDMLTASILSMDTNTEIRIILKAIDKNDALKDLFTQIIKERILAKTALTQNYKEFGLKDKKLEILLGQMLFMQMDNKNKGEIDLTYIDSDGTQKEVTGKENDLINKITQDTEKAMRKDEVAINSIIEIILVYGDSYKDKQMAKQLDVNDARNYRAMMAAA